MRSLCFSQTRPGAKESGSRRIRAARFEARSLLPIGAACVVANGVRETLGSLLGTPIAMRLFEPSIPSPAAWQAIVESARLYRVRGGAADAAIVLRARDACSFASALFGEPHQSAERVLSPLECEVLDRMVSGIAANLGSVSGKRDGGLERVGAIAGFVTYFEILVEDPLAARIGIALSCDPSPESRGALELKHFAQVELEAFALLDLGTIDAAGITQLSVGSVLSIDRAALRRCALSVRGALFAHGVCGIANGRHAFTLDALVRAG